MKKLAMVLPQAKRPPGRPKKIRDHRKLDHIEPPAFASPEAAIETLLIFDARCLDAARRRELLRLLPEILRIRQAWRAEFMECGCVSCHKKTPVYGAGGVCGRCWARILLRMRTRYRKQMANRDVTAELATFKEALTLRFSAAQRLLNGDDE